MSTDPSATVVHVRPAVPEDAAVLASLLTQLGYPSTTEDMERRLAAILPRSDYRTLVAVAGRQVVGMAGNLIGPYYERNGRAGRVLAMVVDEAWRGRGVGGLLLAESEHWLISQGADTIVITSGKQRKDAHRFYEERGYTRNGVRFARLIAATKTTQGMPPSAE